MAVVYGMNHPAGGSDGDVGGTAGGDGGWLGSGGYMGGGLGGWRTARFVTLTELVGTPRSEAT